MKKIIIILQNLLIISLLLICFILISMFIFRLNRQKVDTTYMWNINFSNLKITDGSKNADLLLNQNELGLDITLENELEYYEFSIDIENSGSLSAKISNININVDNEKNILTYKCTYDNNEEIKVGDIVESYSTRTIKVRIDYPKQEEKIYDALSLKLNLTIDFETA